jgi:hypothetical protein
MFDNVDACNRRLMGGAAPMVHVIHGANHKTYMKFWKSAPYKLSRYQQARVYL